MLVGFVEIDEVCFLVQAVINVLDLFLDFAQAASLPKNLVTIFRMMLTHFEISSAALQAQLLYPGCPSKLRC